MADPGQGDQPATRLEEPDQLPAELDALGHVPKGVIELISLVQHLRDSQVRLGRVERGEVAALGGEAQARSVGPQRRCELASCLLDRRQGVAGRDQGIGIGCRPALGQHRRGNRLSSRHPSPHPVGSAARQPAGPEPRPRLLLGQQGQRRACRLGHRLGITPSSGKLGAKQRDRGRHLGHHAGMGRHGRLRLPLSVVEGPLGLVQEVLGLVQVAEVELHLPLGEAQRRAGPYRLGWEQRQPPLQEHALPAAEGLVHVLFHQPHRPDRVP